MICVQLSGGLGNQLFQYAMGRSLSLDHGAALTLDLSFFDNYEWHVFSLAPFAAPQHFASREQVTRLLDEHKYFSSRVARRLFGRRSWVIQEPGLRFDRRWLEIRPPAYLMGYWQCARYFERHASTIREDFRIVTPPSEANQQMLERIRQQVAVSLHVRRGNFVQVDIVNKVHGVASADYYQSAINYLKKKYGQLTFFVFSDDTAWAKAHFQGREFVVVEGNDAPRDYEDLRLMSQCKHHILANSTFSWWGAWLNASPEKCVIAPRQWFADPAKNEEAVDIIPDSWVRL